MKSVGGATWNRAWELDTLMEWTVGCFRSTVPALRAEGMVLAANRNSHRRIPHASAVVCLIAAAVIVTVSQPALATWSIIIVDTETGEIAVGSATCLDNFDLQLHLPVVIVDIGAACAQSMVDSTASNRMTIHEQFLLGTPPEEILEILARNDSSHQARQYGIVDTRGRAVTFTGTEDGPHASGVTGQSGSLVYAIQGNVLTGAPVVLDAEQAVLTTPGGLPEKLMAAMEAARAMGGDGRCSCSFLNPEFCGVPPIDFDKAAHIGFMIVTRGGDIDGVCTQDSGCASGDYFMNFNIPFQAQSDPDPVLQMREAFDAWRADLVGEPDAVHSIVTLDPPWLRVHGASSATMTVTLRDWLDDIVPGGSLSVSVNYAEGSDMVAMPWQPVYIGDGVYQIPIHRLGNSGVDVYDVKVSGGGRPVVLLPRPTFRVVNMEDFDGDGDVDPFDYSELAGCLTGPDGAPVAECVVSDVDRDDDVDLSDFARFQKMYTNSTCRELQIVEQPERLNLCVGDPLTLTVQAAGDPAPTFQWRQNGVPIPGAVEATYSLDAVDETDEGFYSVDVINTCGIIESEQVPVRVIPAEDCP